MSHKKPDSNPMMATNPNMGAELERLRAQATGAVPLLIDEDETMEIEATEIATIRIPGAGRAPSIHATEAESPTLLPERVKASIEVIGGPALGMKFSLLTIATAIGRASASIRVDDPRMSRVHASFAYVDDEFRVRDAGSANGTYLNGAKVADYPLRDGDKLLLGETTLLFHFARRA